MAGYFKRAPLGALCVDDGGVQTGPFGSQLHQEDYVSVGTPIITVEHLGENRIIRSNLPRVSDNDRERLSRYSLQEGDIVFSRVGSVDRRALVRKEEEGWLFSGRCLRVRVDKNRICPQFLSWVFGLEGFKQHIRRVAVGATMPSINTKILSDIPVYFPPLPEQQAIAEILGALDDKIELNRLMNATLEAMAQALFQSWFVDFAPVRAKLDGRLSTGLDPETAALFPATFQDSPFGHIPQGWKVMKVEELAERVAMGPFGSSIKISTFVSEGIPVISGQHLREMILEDSVFNFVTHSHADQLKRSNVQRGDVIFTHAGSIGQVALIPESSQFSRYIISQRQFYMRCHRSKMSPLYVVMYFKTPDGQHRLLANTSSTGVPSIAQPVTYLRQLQLVVPPPNLLARFDEIVGEWMQQITANFRQSSTLATLRDSLLPKLLSGELRVKDL
jgi:type I restriction enzyme S subunit